MTGATDTGCIDFFAQFSFDFSGSMTQVSGLRFVAGGEEGEVEQDRSSGEGELKLKLRNWLIHEAGESSEEGSEILEKVLTETLVPNILRGLEHKLDSLVEVRASSLAMKEARVRHLLHIPSGEATEMAMTMAQYRKHCAEAVYLEITRESPQECPVLLKGLFVCFMFVSSLFVWCLCYFCQPGFNPVFQRLLQV